MGFFKLLRFFLSLLRISIRSSISVRGAFLLEATIILVNNFVFLLMWWVFFKQFKDVAGWTMHDMISLYAIGMGGYGLSQIFFGGTRLISKVILQGDLDPFMTQPKNLLVHLMGSKSFSKGWGNLMTTLVLIFIGKLTSFSTLLLLVTGTVCSCLVFTSMSVIAHSLVFWLGPVDMVSRKYCDSLFLFALYPSNIYSGLLQVMMFTIIPAGIIGYLPIELLRSFSWIKLVCLLGASGGLFTLAFFIFHLGLKRYESGNQFGMRL